MRVTLNSLTTLHCKRALNVTLIEQYPLKSVEECTLAPPIPEGSSFLALGCDTSCLKDPFDLDDPLENGEEYVISGNYEVDEAEGYDDAFWNLSLIAVYDRKKFRKDPIGTANTRRGCSN